MTLKTANYCAVLILVLLISGLASANCNDLKGKKIRLSNGALLLHSGGDLFRAQGLEQDTYNLHLNRRKFVLMRVNYEHFKCFE